MSEFIIGLDHADRPDMTVIYTPLSQGCSPLLEHFKVLLSARLPRKLKKQHKKRGIWRGTKQVWKCFDGYFAGFEPVIRDGLMTMDLTVRIAE